MRYARRAAKRDLAEVAIIEALERVGAHVWQLDYPADLLVRHASCWYVLEVKTGRGRALTVAQDKRQAAQIKFLEDTGTPIVRTAEEALRAIGAIAG